MRNLADEFSRREQQKESITTHTKSIHKREVLAEVAKKVSGLPTEMMQKNSSMFGKNQPQLMMLRKYYAANHCGNSNDSSISSRTSRSYIPPPQQPMKVNENVDEDDLEVSEILSLLSGCSAPG